MKLRITIGIVAAIVVMFIWHAWRPFSVGPSVDEISAAMNVKARDSHCSKAIEGSGYWCSYSFNNGSRSFTGRRRFAEIKGQWWAVE
uniref:Uncharacterized protein n=1 Tax=Rhizobium rhizogenes TaxID=359 RepID=A0A7S5DQZ3_RHIRH|nr:hypothetical protein [Rhizobium rhizogenes]QCL10028.1 hypothetical protein pC5.8d_725 [Rhizobium rhizogenes]